MWASGHNGDYRRAAHRYEPTREAAMQAFAKSWRGARELPRLQAPAQSGAFFRRSPTGRGPVQCG